MVSLSAAVYAQIMKLHMSVVLAERVGVESEQVDLMHLWWPGHLSTCSWHSKESRLNAHAGRRLLPPARDEVHAIAGVASTCRAP